jgi:hypothetical protein
MKKQQPKNRTQALSDERLKMLADRMAMLLVICNAMEDDGEEWNPWALDRTYDGSGSMGEGIRKMKDYKTAKGIVRRWIKTKDAETIKGLEA